MILSILLRFIWNGTATAPDYHGDSHDCDFYTAPDFTFKYWTAISTVSWRNQRLVTIRTRPKLIFYSSSIPLSYSPQHRPRIMTSSFVMAARPTGHGQWRQQTQRRRGTATYKDRLESLTNSVFVSSSWRDHLNVTAIDPSTFDLFSDPATCAVSCGDFLGLEEREQAEMDERVRRHGPIAMALHHHNMAQKEREQQQAHHHKHHHGHHQTTPKKLH